MKWTALAIAAALMIVPSAFGAEMWLAVGGQTGTVVVDNTQPVDVELWLGGDVPNGVAGFEGFMTASEDIDVTARVFGAVVNAGTPFPSSASVTGNGLKKTKALGSITLSDMPAASFPAVLQVLTLNVPTLPTTLDLTEIMAADGLLNVYPTTAGVPLTLTPEPASLLLLAIGGLFLRRRR